MKTNTLFFCALLAVSGSVYASNSHGDDDNGNNGGNASSSSSATGGAGGNGGQGGAGGSANNAVTIGIGNANTNLISNRVENTNLVSNRSENTNVNLNSARAVGGNQSQGQSQQQSAAATGGSATSSADSNSQSGASASNTGNSQSVTFVAPAAPSKVTVRNTPDAVGIAAAPSANCRVTHGVGVGVTGLGISASSSTLDEGCDTREDARALREAGLYDASIQRMCAKPELKKALGPLCFE